MCRGHNSLAMFSYAWVPWVSEVSGWQQPWSFSSSPLSPWWFDVSFLTRVTVVHSLHSYSHSLVSSQLLPSKLRALGAWAGTRHKNSAQNIDLQRISKEIRAYVKICIFFLQSYILLCPRAIGRTELIWIGLWVCTHTHTGSTYKRKLVFSESGLLP